jgi:adenylate cyclase
MIHPALPARLDRWNRGSGTRVHHYDSKLLAEGEQWIGTPAQVAQATGRTVVYTIGEMPAFDDRADMARLAARGYTQLVCLPLHSRYTPAINSVSFATKRADGFSKPEIAAFRRLQAPIARVTEGFIQHESTVAVLSTYVGRDAGDRVLTGNIRRGQTETIPAIVLFVDLKNFTKMSNRLAPEAVVEMLNRFFSALDDAIRAQGGEILKFIGDGALGVFPTPDDYSAQAAAAVGALASLEDVGVVLSTNGDPLAFRAALHLGDVHYGNIGSDRRLDFTVIGPTVNLASRLLQVASDADEDAVCSADFAALLDTPPRLLDERELRGFEGAVPVFALEINRRDRSSATDTC